jgi:hypothetical protein
MSRARSTPTVLARAEHAARRIEEQLERLLEDGCGSVDASSTAAGAGVLLDLESAEALAEFLVESEDP